MHKAIVVTIANATRQLEVARRGVGHGAVHAERLMDGEVARLA
jgi:hypothetical protein